MKQKIRAIKPSVRDLGNVKTPFNSTLVTEMIIELEDYGIGLRSGRGQLNKGLNFAIQYLLENLRAGKVQVPPEMLKVEEDEKPARSRGRRPRQ